MPAKYAVYILTLAVTGGILADASWAKKVASVKPPLDVAALRAKEDSKLQQQREKENKKREVSLQKAQQAYQEAADEVVTRKSNLETAEATMRQADEDLRQAAAAFSRGESDMKNVESRKKMLTKCSEARDKASKDYQSSLKKEFSAKSKLEECENKK